MFLPFFVSVFLNPLSIRWYSYYLWKWNHNYTGKRGSCCEKRYFPFGLGFLSTISISALKRLKRFTNEWNIYKWIGFVKNISSELRNLLFGTSVHDENLYSTYRVVLWITYDCDLLIVASLYTLYSVTMC